METNRSIEFNNRKRYPCWLHPQYGNHRQNGFVKLADHHKYLKENCPLLIDNKCTDSLTNHICKHVLSIPEKWEDYIVELKKQKDHLAELLDEDQRTQFNNIGRKYVEIAEEVIKEEYFVYERTFNNNKSINYVGSDKTYSGVLVGTGLNDDKIIIKTAFRPIGSKQFKEFLEICFAKFITYLKKDEIIKIKSSNIVDEPIQILNEVANILGVDATTTLKTKLPNVLHFIPFPRVFTILELYFINEYQLEEWEIFFIYKLYKGHFDQIHHIIKTFLYSMDNDISKVREIDQYEYKRYLLENIEKKFKFIINEADQILKKSINYSDKINELDEWRNILLEPYRIDSSNETIEKYGSFPVDFGVWLGEIIGKVNGVSPEIEKNTDLAFFQKEVRKSCGILFFT